MEREEESLQAESSCSSESSSPQWRAGRESGRIPPIVVEEELQKRPLESCKLLLRINCSYFLKLFALSITLKAIVVKPIFLGYAKSLFS